MLRFPRLVSEEDRFLRETSFLSLSVISTTSRIGTTLQIT